MSNNDSGSAQLSMPEQVLFGRLRWFIHIRWLAVLGVLVAVATGRYLLDISFDARPLLLIVCAMVVYNLAFLALARAKYERATVGSRAIIVFALVQIVTDLVALMLLVFVSGGIENPFLFFFIFHVVIASELLPKRWAYVLTALISAMVCATVALQYYEIFPHVHMTDLAPVCALTRPVYLLEVCVVFTLTLFVTVHFTTTIAGKVRAQHRLVENANVQCQIADDQRSFFMRKVSHDLKAPLTAIQSLLKAVLGGYTGPVDAKQKELIERASKRSDHALALITDLLKYSRVQSFEQTVPFVPTKIFDAFAELIDRVTPIAKQKHIVLDVDVGEAECLGDKDLLEEAFANLLENAVRYTPDGGRVSVKVHPEGDRIHVDVSDTGIGIPEDEIGSIFDEYFRATNAKTFESYGTGLGLALAKRIVNMHKGNIRVESTVGEGTTFHVELPCG